MGVGTLKHGAVLDLLQQQVPQQLGHLPKQRRTSFHPYSYSSFHPYSYYTLHSFSYCSFDPYSYSSLHSCSEAG